MNISCHVYVLESTLLVAMCCNWSTWQHHSDNWHVTEVHMLHLLCANIYYVPFSHYNLESSGLTTCIYTPHITTCSMVEWYSIAIIDVLCTCVLRWIVVAKDKSVSPASWFALLYPTPHQISIVPDNLEQQEQTYKVAKVPIPCMDTTWLIYLRPPFC